MYWESVDPGIKYAARAIWDGVTLTAVTVTPLAEMLRKPPKTLVGVIERPKLMLRRRVSASMIENLLISYGQLSTCYVRVAPWPPHSMEDKAWKRRVLSRLSPGELAIVRGGTKAEQEHTIDAVGVGLEYQGRM